MDYYDDSMPIVPISDDDYKKYYIDERLFETDKINMVLNKGSIFQKQVLLSNITTYISSPDCIKQILSIISPVIAIWEDFVQITYNDALLKLTEKIINENLITSHLSVIHDILYHLIKIIVSSEDDKRYKEYLINLSSIINVISQQQKIILPEEVIDYAMSIGKLNHNNKRNKICAFLCSSLIRIIKGDFKELFKRLISLSYNTDKELRYQLSYDFNFLLRDTQDANIIKEVTNIIMYSFTENDVVIQSNNLCALLTNWTKCNEIIRNLNQSKTKGIKWIIERIGFVFNSNDNNDSDFDIITQLYTTLVNFFSDTVIITQIQSIEYNDMIVFKEKETIQLYLTKYYCSFSNANKHKIKLSIVIDLFSKELKALKAITSDNSYIERFCNRLYLLIKNSSQSDQILFLKHLNIIGPQLSSSLLNTILETDINIFLNESFHNMVHIFKLNNSNENSLSIFLDNIMKVDLSKISHQCLVYYFLGVKHFIKHIYYRPKIKKKEEFYGKMIFKGRSMIHLKKGFHISQEIIEMMIEIIKYSKKRDEIIIYFLDLSVNPSFYKRRVFHIFLQSSIKSFSVHFLYDNNIWNRFLILLESTKIPIELAKMIDLLTMDFLSLVTADKNLFRILDVIQRTSYGDRELLLKVSRLYLLMEKEKGIRNTLDQNKYLQDDQRKYREEQFIAKEELDLSSKIQYKPPIGPKSKIKTVRNEYKLPPVSLQSTMRNFIPKGSKTSNHSESFQHKLSNTNELSSSSSASAIRGNSKGKAHSNRSSFRILYSEKNVGGLIKDDKKNQSSKTINTKVAIGLNSQKNLNNNIPKPPKKNTKIVFPKIDKH